MMTMHSSAIDLWNNCAANWISSSTICTSTTHYTLKVHKSFLQS